MRLATIIVSLLAVVLLTVLYFQYEGLLRQVAKHPSFSFSNIEHVSIKPTAIDSIKIEATAIPIYHFGDTSLTHIQIVLPGLGFYLDDWFLLCDSLSKTKAHVITFPMEFSFPSRTYSWGVFDQTVLERLLDKMAINDSITLTIFDLSVTVLDHFTPKRQIHYNLVNPRITRSTYLQHLSDLSFGFSFEKPIKHIINDLSTDFAMSDTITFTSKSQFYFYFNPNITIDAEFLNLQRTNLTTDWEYGKLDVADIVSHLTKK